MGSLAIFALIPVDLAQVVWSIWIAWAESIWSAPILSRISSFLLDLVILLVHYAYFRVAATTPRSSLGFRRLRFGWVPSLQLASGMSAHLGVAIKMR